MLQIKIVHGMTVDELTLEANMFLETISDDAVKDIIVDAAEGYATIKYVVEEEYKNALCCDCRYWDDSGDCESLIGLCHECGGRKRFSQKACPKFKDVRGCK